MPAPELQAISPLYNHPLWQLAIKIFDSYEYSYQRNSISAVELYSNPPSLPGTVSDPSPSKPKPAFAQGMPL